MLAAGTLQAKAPEAADPLAGTTHEAGFVDVYRDANRGKVLIGVHDLDQPFLLVTSLPGGLGSNDVGLDRGQLGKQYIARFRRVGERLLLIADNMHYVANSSDADEQRSAVDAFTTSVLWAGPIVKRAAQPGEPPMVLVDIAPYLAGDRHGIAISLAGRDGKASYRVDAERSVALPEAARSFPDNSEFEALLTFSRRRQGRAGQPGRGRSDLAQPAPARQLRAPAAARLHPARLPSGIGRIEHQPIDFAQPLGKSLDVRWQPRFRLQTRSPARQVIKPIVFYLDRGTPEPIRSALLDGARWWAKAFEQAGFTDAFRVELLPEGVDPMDIRYNIITWTHRDTRGWSYGNAIIDPRTGEIIKGAVNLGSQRVRQDILIAEALLAPYDKRQCQRAGRPGAADGAGAPAAVGRA